MVNNPSNKIKSESVDEVILRLLGLNPGTEIDYQTYHEILKKKLAIARLAGKELPREEDELLREEFKRVRRIKDKGIRFKIKKGKTKVSSSESQVDQKKLSGTSSIVKSKSAKITSQNVIQVNVKDITEKKEDKKENISPIRKILDSILKILASKFKFQQKQNDQERREKESEKRSKRESTLEGFKKGIAGIVSLTKKMLAPFDTVIDRIKRFIFFTLLGRAFTKFMDWMNDKQNQKKFDAFVEFLSDHWPALAGLYILFGTSFGKLVRGLLKGTAKMIVALAMNIPKIFAFIKKNKKLSFLALAAAPFVSREVSNLFIDKETPESGLIPTTNPDLDDAKKSTDQAAKTKIPTLNFGGMIPKFNLGGMIPSFAMGGAMNSFGGMDFLSGVPITGAGKDDTLIAAKTGEAILTEKDQVDLSQRYVDRNTGEPLNIPQYLSGRKPGFVNADKIGFRGNKFPTAASGGIIQKFNEGGLVGGLNSLGRDTFGRVGEAYGRYKGRETGIPGGGWFGEQLGRRKGEKLYDKITSPFRGFKTGGIVPKVNVGGRKKVKPDYTPEQIKNYQQVYSLARKYGATFPQLTAAMAMNETGWLKHMYGNNPFNQRGEDGKFLNYKTLEESVAHHVRLWDKKRPGMTNIAEFKDPNEAFAGIVNSYAPPSENNVGHYKSNVRRIMSDMQQYNPPTMSAKNAPFMKRKKSNNFLSNFGQFMPTSFPFKRGGLIKENTGMDIPGATADRQLISAAVQPGEQHYIIPKLSVERGIVPIVDHLVALTDRNSDAYLKKKSINRPEITPYRSKGIGTDGVMTLPPIMQGSGRTARASGYAGASGPPSFSAVSPMSDRDKNATIYYGIK